MLGQTWNQAALAGSSSADFCSPLFSVGFRIFPQAVTGRGFWGRNSHFRSHLASSPQILAFFSNTVQTGTGYWRGDPEIRSRREGKAWSRGTASTFLGCFAASRGGHRSPKPRPFVGCISSSSATLRHCWSPWKLTCDLEKIPVLTFSLISRVVMTT